MEKLWARAKSAVIAVGRLAKQAMSSWLHDRGQSMGASLAYYTVFSIAPLVLIVVAIAGLLFGAQNAREYMLSELRSLMGEQGAAAVRSILAATTTPDKSVVAMIVGVLTLLIGATSVFAELQDILNHIWRTPARDKSSGLWQLLRARLLSFGMILGICFLLMVSLVASAALSAIEGAWNPVFGRYTFLASGVNLLVGYALATLVFALIYKVMPRAIVAWRDVWIGAAVTAALFSLGKYLIGLYVAKSGVSSSFGAAGSLVVVLVWVYYSAQILLIGAEFTWVYAQKRAPAIAPH